MNPERLLVYLNFFLSVDATCIARRHRHKETFLILSPVIWKCIFLHSSILQILDKINKRFKLPQCPGMYLHSVRVEVLLLHETILRVDIVATNVAWESVKANSQSRFQSFVPLDQRSENESFWEHPFWNNKGNNRILHIRFHGALRSLHLWYLWRMPEMDASRSLVFRPLVKGNEALGFSRLHLNLHTFII